MECTVNASCNIFLPIYKHTFTCFIKKLINTDNLNDSYSQQCNFAKFNTAALLTNCLPKITNSTGHTCAF